MSKAATIAAVTAVFAFARSAAADKLAALPDIQQQQLADLQKTVADLQAQLTQQQATLLALPATQASDLQAAQDKVTAIDASQASVIANLTQGLPDDPADPAATAIDAGTATTAVAGTAPLPAAAA